MSELTRVDSSKSESDSIVSFMSDDLDNDEEERKEYTEAPDDIKYSHGGKDVRVLKQGKKVPCETKYKKVNDTTAIKFRFVQLKDFILSNLNMIC